MDYTIRIGGEAGQGVQTVGELLGLVFARFGYHVFSNQDYESRVRGGHNYYQIRVADRRVMSSRESVDILIALDRASIDLHLSSLTAGGIAAFDAATLGIAADRAAMIDIPFKQLSTKHGGGPVMANTAATGAVLGMLGMDIGVLETLLGEHFGKKGDAVVQGNLRVARAGYEYARANCTECRFMPAAASGRPLLLINGSEAAAYGALASGLKFYSAYPMTPSTGVMNYLAASAAKYGVVMEQAEDEIAAINMALGASFAGVRAATGSSGGGFALMVEGLSLSAMTETPIVIFEVMRPGPATGLPTRTEQGDLLFVAFTGHGEFPRAVFAAGSPEQLIFLTNKAFELAYKYQIPVFVMYDQYLADAQWTYEGFDTSKLKYTDYFSRDAKNNYKRYEFTESGITPLCVPGSSTNLVKADSDEHDEDGHIIEEAQARINMVQKRLLKKLPSIRAGIAQPLRYGAVNPELILCGWGSTYGVLKEAVDAIEGSAMLYFNEVYPLPEGDYLDWLKSARRTVCVEGNATGQFASLMRMTWCYEFSSSIARYDGRPFTVDYIMRAL